MVRVDLDDGGAHTLREKALRVWRNGLVSLGDEVPRSNIDALEVLARPRAEAIRIRSVVE